MEIARITELVFNRNNGQKFIYKAVKGGDLDKVIKYPKYWSDKDVIEFRYITKENNKEEKSKLPLQLLKKEKPAEIDYRNYPDLDAFRKYYSTEEGIDVDNFIQLGYDLSTTFEINDITDYEFNNFERITKVQLEKPGLWIGNGERRLEFIINNLSEKQNEKDEDAAKKINRYIEQEKIGISAFFNKKDNDELDSTIHIDGNIKRKKVLKKVETSFILLLDTDNMIRYMGDEPYYTFGGKINVQIADTDGRYKVTETFQYPFKIRFVDPEKYVENGEKYVVRDKVIIDFGTSSTCIAFNNGKKMISFTDNPKTDLDYENPTAMAIFNWEKVYKTWNKENLLMPHFNILKSKVIGLINEDDHYSYGYDVIRKLISAKSKYTNCVISDLKSLPGKLRKKGTKEEFIPYLDGNSYIKLTHTIKEENEETLNPISLYGYLLGRSINRQVENKVYVNYELTMPVKFDEFQKKSIKDSLEFGLKRAVPETLKKQFKLNTGYSEPVALLGSRFVSKYINPNKNNEVLFAVFDFGGGTLDFSFGLSRRPEEKSDIPGEINEVERYNKFLEIFRTGGEIVGGETLIRDLSYEIYKDNKNLMKERNIPVYVENGRIINNFPSSLQGHTQIHKVNLKLINENYSRKFFKGEKIDEDRNISFININGDEVDLKLRIDNEKYDRYLYSRIKPLVKGFKKAVEDVFTEKKFSKRIKKYNLNINKNLIIFLAGNSSRASWVKKSFNDVFKSFFEGDELEKRIKFIEDKSKNISPKNVVAKGASRFSEETGVYDWQRKSGQAPLEVHIVRPDYDDDEIVEKILKKGDGPDIGWVRYGKTGGRDFFKIHYTLSDAAEDFDDDNIKHQDVDIPKKLKGDGSMATVYLRPTGQYQVEFILGGHSAVPDAGEKGVSIELQAN